MGEWHQQRLPLEVLGVAVLVDDAEAALAVKVGHAPVENAVACQGRGRESVVQRRGDRASHRRCLPRAPLNCFMTLTPRCSIATDLVTGLDRLGARGAKRVEREISLLRGKSEKNFATKLRRTTLAQ